MSSCCMFYHLRMRTFWRSCSGYRLGADRTYRHFQLWQSVKRPPSGVCSVSLTKFDFLSPGLTVYCASHSLYIPYIRLGPMEQEDDETGTKNSNVAVDPESCVTVALPEVRLGMSIITQRLFFVDRTFPRIYSVINIKRM